MAGRHLLLLLFSLIFVGYSGCSKQKQFGSVIDVTGTAHYFGKNSKKWKILKKNTAIHQGDSIKTDDTSQVEIKFDKSAIRLEEKSLVCIKDSISDKRRAISVENLFGGVLSSLNDLDTNTTVYKVVTPTSVAQAKGTHYMVIYEPVSKITQVNVFTGIVTVFNPFLPVPPIFVPPGFFTTVHFSQAPIVPVRINHGQLKRMERILGPTHFQYYNKSFFIPPPHNRAFSPHHGPDKHMLKGFNKGHKGELKGMPLLPPSPLLVPARGEHVKEHKGKTKGRKHK